MNANVVEKSILKYLEVIYFCMYDKGMQIMIPKISRA
jgi:hypothetical protein